MSGGVQILLAENTTDKCIINVRACAIATYCNCYVSSRAVRYRYVIACTDKLTCVTSANNLAVRC